MENLRVSINKEELVQTKQTVVGPLYTHIRIPMAHGPIQQISHWNGIHIGCHVPYQCQSAEAFESERIRYTCHSPVQ